jgi:hypothetical protein
MSAPLDRRVEDRLCSVETPGRSVEGVPARGSAEVDGLVYVGELDGVVDELDGVGVGGTEGG